MTNLRFTLVLLTIFVISFGSRPVSAERSRPITGADQHWAQEKTYHVLQFLFPGRALTDLTEEDLAEVESYLSYRENQALQTEDAKISDEAPNTSTVAPSSSPKVSALATKAVKKKPLVWRCVYKNTTWQILDPDAGKLFACNNAVRATANNCAINTCKKGETFLPFPINRLRRCSLYACAQFRP
jgi:hypothetical protein